MKILWLCNIVLPEFSVEFGFRKVNVGGWLSAMWSELRKKENVTLGICVPVRDQDRMKDGILEDVSYYSFLLEDYSGNFENQKARFTEILRDFQPDLIHIWGTEYQHTLAMVHACNDLKLINSVLVNIQGLVSVYALHYGTGLSEALINMECEGRSISQDIEDFCMKGNKEIECLRMVKNVVGRTDWDKACSMQINPQLKYFKCGEILRHTYNTCPCNWSLAECERHSIFISQAGYPVKGFHLILKQIADLKEKYADLIVYVAGSNILQKTGTYAHYIKTLITEFGLQSTVKMLGMLSEEEMYRYYLKANVFLSASTIENSSNSVCEAIRVGTPVVASCVGGIPSIIEHGNSGFLYPLEESYMMAYYIEQIFDDDKLAERISKNETERSLIFNNRDKCVADQMRIYDLVFERSKESEKGN